MLAVILGFAAILLIVLIVLKQRSKGDETVHESDSQSTSSERATYHAVSIKFDNQACDAARELAGSRFLSVDAPRLPLSKCDAATCNCRFAHHQDRRTGKDRRSPFSAPGIGGGTGWTEKRCRATRKIGAPQKPETRQFLVDSPSNRNRLTGPGNSPTRRDDTRAAHATLQFPLRACRCALNTP